MRLRRILGTALGVAAALGALVALGALGLDSTMMPRSAPAPSPGPADGDSWVITATGSPTPGPPVSGGSGTRPPALPPVSFLPIEPGCATNWSVDSVLIPMSVEPGAGSLTVTWPRQGDSNYRITAVPQELVRGNQPAQTWLDVPPVTGCTGTATIRGLTAGQPYVVWLDAPNTGHGRDGQRNPYSGKSGLVYPL